MNNDFDFGKMFSWIILIISPMYLIKSTVEMNIFGIISSVILFGLGVAYRKAIKYWEVK